MLKLNRFVAVISVILMAMASSCSLFEQNQNISGISNAQDLSAASGRSNSSKVALASHLKQIDAKFYGTYWCGYCNQQKQLFGQQAMSKINYVECDPQGKNARPELCQKANIEGFPTWEIKGQQYRGIKSLDELADFSNYKGDRNFGS